MKRLTWIVIGVVSLLLLAGAVFVGGRMLNARNQTSSEGNAFGSMTTQGIGGARSFDILAADEIPASSPDANGVLMRREDKSLVVGTGDVEIHVDGEEVGSSHSGPDVEVVVTHDTAIYCDKTEYTAIAAEDGHIQQSLTHGSLEEIDRNTIISAWGDKHGDRLFAEVIVYREIGQ
jgi:hypothetical protein